MRGGEYILIHAFGVCLRDGEHALFKGGEHALLKWVDKIFFRRPSHTNNVQR